MKDASSVASVLFCVAISFIEYSIQKAKAKKKNQCFESINRWKQMTIEKVQKLNNSTLIMRKFKYVPIHRETDKVFFSLIRWNVYVN